MSAIQPISGLKFDVAKTGVLQAPEPEHQIMRYELTDFERAANQTVPSEQAARRAEGQRPERTLEAMRRVLPELTTLVRYEQRAAARRDRAIRQIAGLKESRD
jgi:hypothetical protein